LKSYSCQLERYSPGYSTYYSPLELIFILYIPFYPRTK
jgi:hypothetical protein